MPKPSVCLPPLTRLTTTPWLQRPAGRRFHKGAFGNRSLGQRNEPSRRLCEVSQNTLHLARSSRHGLHSRIGRTARAWKDGDPNPLSDDALVQQALVSSLQALQPGTTSSDTSEAVQFIRAADTMLVQSAASGVSSSALAVALAKNQKAIVSKVIGGYASLTENGEAIGTLVISQQDLEAQSSSFASINVFPPSAPDFSASIRAGDWSAGNQLASIPGTDADGDAISYSIASATSTWMGTEPCPCRFRPRAFCRLATPMT